MKRVFTVFIALLLALSCCACMESAKNSGINVPGSDTSKATEEPDGSNGSPDSTEPYQPYLWLMYNGEMVMPYMSFSYGRSYYENEDGTSGFLEADGPSFFQQLPMAIGEIPEVGSNFETMLGENCRVVTTNYYDPATFERIKIKDSEEFPKGDIVDIVIEMIVEHTGEFIESEGEYELDAYSCVFLVKADGSESEPSAENLYLRLSWNGKLISPYSSFYCGKTYVENEEGGGSFLYADGMSIFYQLPGLIGDNQLPEVGPGFETVLYTDCRIVKTYAYDPVSFERLGMDFSDAELQKLLDENEGGVIVEMLVCHTGKYIESEDDHEYDEYSFAFIVKKSAPSDTETSSVNPRFNENGMLRIISGSEVILPLEHDVPGDKLTSYSGLVEEGDIPFNYYLPEIYEDLPIVDSSKGFELEVYEWGTIYQINVYNAYFGTIANGLTEWELYSFAAENNMELIVDVRIFVPGDSQIFDEPTERTGTGYAFRLIAGDPSVPMQTPETPPTPEPKPEPTPVPDTEVVMYLPDLNALEALLKSSIAEYPEDRFLGIDGYYVPDHLPEADKAVVDQVRLTPEKLEIEYNITAPQWDYEEGDPHSYVLTWHRNVGTDEVQELVDGIIAECADFDRCVEKNGVWVIQTNGLVNYAVWVTERNDVLELSFPFCYSEVKDAVKLAQAEWVQVK